MAKICPSCRFQVVDDDALFCNKCGYPFPKSRPGRPAAVAPASRLAPASSRRPSEKPSRASGFLLFETLITTKYLKLIYIIGAVLIIVVSVMGIAGMFAKPLDEGTTISITDTTALAQDPAGSPFFWIGFLVAGSILWRMFCELFVVLFRGHEVPDTGVETAPEDEPEDYGEEGAAEPGEEAEPQYAECPKCSKIVTVDQLRVCERCGVEGCSNCIRPMGLLKKSMTCRECFEGD